MVRGYLSDFGVWDFANFRRYEGLYLFWQVWDYNPGDIPRMSGVRLADKIS